jgi:hypothetical protein
MMGIEKSELLLTCAIVAGGIVLITSYISLCVIMFAPPPAPWEDRLVSPEMADYLMKQGHGRDFGEEDME